jgi:hypothetical protein
LYDANDEAKKDASGFLLVHRDGTLRLNSQDRGVRKHLFGISNWQSLCQRLAVSVEFLAEI